MSLLNGLLEGGWWKWSWSIMSLVYKSLDQDWITVASLQLFKVAKSKILKTVDFTKVPEDVIFIFSLSLDFEMLSEIWINWFTFCDSVEHLSLGKWSRGIEVKISLNILLSISLGNTILKESELGDKIVIVQISVWVDSKSSLGPVKLI